MASNPANGWAYTPIELEAIWAMPVELKTITDGLQFAFDFHHHAAMFPNNIMREKDKEAEETIIRAILAEDANPYPAEPDPWPCPIHYDDGSPKNGD